MSETQLGQVMSDLSRGSLPILIVGTLVAGVGSAAYWVGSRNQDLSQNNSSLTAQVARLDTQIQAMSAQMQQINLTLAMGPKMPENVAYKYDLQKFCLKNKELVCPEF